MSSRVHTNSKNLSQDPNTCSFCQNYDSFLVHVLIYIYIYIYIYAVAILSQTASVV
jgi:hypothetical protein